MNIQRVARCAFGAAIIVALSACGGGGSASIGGTLSGLLAGSSVVLQDNGGDNLTLTSNGSFTFATTVGTESPYSVTVLTQPAGQTCTIVDGAGTVDVDGTDVTSVSVSCVVTPSSGG